MVSLMSKFIKKFVLVGMIVLVISIFQIVFATSSAEEFTILVIPDTQYYAESYPDVYTNQTQWIVENKDSLNIQFVVHVGDIVNAGSNTTQWDRANTSMSLLDGVVDYLVVPGNHDYASSSPSGGDLTNYNTYFNYTRFDSYGYYGGHYPNNGNQNNYGLFTVGDYDFIVLGLGFCPSDAELNWADSILTTYEDREKIIFTHIYMNYDNTRVIDRDANSCRYYKSGHEGDSIYTNFIQSHTKVRMVFSGHIVGGTTGRRMDVVEGTPCHQILQNYQFVGDDDEGWLRYYTFKIDENKIEATTYSPYLGTYNNDSSNQFSLWWDVPNQ